MASLNSSKTLSLVSFLVSVVLLVVAGAGILIAGQPTEPAAVVSKPTPTPLPKLQTPQSSPAALVPGTRTDPFN